MPTAKINDEKIILSKIAMGDRAAYAQFYQAYLTSLYRYIFLFTKSKDDTEEILQEIFVKVWEHRDKLLHVESIKDYLYRMAKCRIIDNIRHRRIRHRVFSEIKYTGTPSQPITSDQCAYKEYYETVQMAVERLSPKRKIIFRLNVENGLSLDEIAAKLNISKFVVKKQLYSAVGFVRQYLHEHSEISLPLFAAALAGFLLK